MLSVAEVLNNQAACSSALGKYAEATTLYEKVGSRIGRMRADENIKGLPYK